MYRIFLLFGSLILQKVKTINKGQAMLREIRESIEREANNQKLPSSIVDWMEARYTELNDRKATIKTAHLYILEELLINKEYAIYLISRDVLENN